MTLLRDDARPLSVDSVEIAENVGQALVLEAARRAAAERSAGSVDSCRMTLPYPGGWMRMIAAALPSLDLLGYKEFHLSSGNVVRYAVHLFALSDGRPLGIVDAALLTSLRTAAAAAVASEWFFGAGAHVRLGVIGSGDEALAGVRALSSVLHLREVKVNSRSATNREKFAAKVTEELNLAARPVDDLAKVTAGVDMVYVATNSGGHVVVGLEHLAQVPFVASIGSTLPAQRELAGGVLVNARRVIVDTWDVLEESGDALEAGELGIDRNRFGLLGDLDTGDVSRSGPTVYKSIGSPEQDLVLAHAILKAAVARGFGRPFEPLSSIKQNL